jgi:hypothetical protein
VETGGGTTATTYTGIVDPTTGNFSTILLNSVFYNQKIIGIGGNTAFDQTNKILYYFDNADSDFVYAVDVVNKKILNMYSSTANQIYGVAFDEANSYLVVSGIYGTRDKSESNAIVFMPTYNTTATKKSQKFNFTQQIGGTPFAGGTVDPKNSIFYTIYSDGGSNVLAIIDINTMKAKSVPLDSQGYYLFDLTYDAANSRLFAIGVQGEVTMVAYVEIDTTTYACNVMELSLSYPVLISTYDPTTQTVYMVSNDQLIPFNVKTHQLGKPVWLQYFVESFAVSYK